MKQAFFLGSILVFVGILGLITSCENTKSINSNNIALVKKSFPNAHGIENYVVVTDSSFIARCAYTILPNFVPIPSYKVSLPNEIVFVEVHNGEVETVQTK